MKPLIILALLFIGIGCNTETKEESTTDFIKRMDKQKKVDSFTQATLNEVYESSWTSDTIGMSSAPVRVIKARMVEKEYSSYKDIHLTYKNFSDKKVDAIKFAWYGLDAFGEPADMGGTGLIPGYGGGFTDDALSPGKTDSGEWSILSRNGKKVLAAWAYEIVFSDGTKWKSPNKSK